MQDWLRFAQLAKQASVAASANRSLHSFTTEPAVAGPNRDRSKAALIRNFIEKSPCFSRWDRSRRSHSCRAQSPARLPIRVLICALMRSRSSTASRSSTSVAPCRSAVCGSLRNSPSPVRTRPAYVMICLPLSCAVRLNTKQASLPARRTKQVPVLTSHPQDKRERQNLSLQSAVRRKLPCGWEMAAFSSAFRDGPAFRPGCRASH